MARFVAVLAVLSMLPATLLFSKSPQSGADIRQFDFDHLGLLLGVERYEGTYSVDGGVKQLAAVAEVQKDGEKAPTEIARGPFVHGDAATRKGKISVLVADLDQLPLGLAKKGHCRVSIMMREGTMTSSYNFDVAKSVFDFTRTVKGGMSSGAAGGDVLIFWKTCKTSAEPGGPAREATFILTLKSLDK